MKNNARSKQRSSVHYTVFETVLGIALGCSSPTMVVVEPANQDALGMSRTLQIFNRA